jgi:hypothetical protein
MATTNSTVSPHPLPVLAGSDCGIVPEAVTQQEDTQGDTQKSEENAIFLEKNSFNFLE